MLSRNQIKYFTSLQQKKFRKQHGVFLVEGDKMVRELLKSPFGLKINRLLALPDFLENVDRIPKEINILAISKNELSRISSLRTPNQAILEVVIPEYSWKYEEIRNTLSIFLEDIRDPGNLGTIIRTADWFGIENIFCSNDSVDVFNPKVIQATMGSFARVKVHYIEVMDFLNHLKSLDNNYRLMATSPAGENLYTSKLHGAGMLLFGNESKGLSNSILQASDQQLTIPSLANSEGPESLNLSISVGIICSEIIGRNYSK